MLPFMEKFMGKNQMLALIATDDPKCRHANAFHFMKEAI
jgi:hypothetical protein